MFHAGPSEQMNWFTTGGAGGHRAAGKRPGGHQMNGNAVMYDTGKILTCGGATSYDGSPATDAAAVITLDGNDASVREVEPMNLARGMANAVALPDGKVLIVGGLATPLVFKDRDWRAPLGAHSLIVCGWASTW